ncbi:hypothetical protein [Dialister invisus]|uniref:hypothetical protein n=1 Tax=Dialister invisus TaxID=218538 RepID=UPI0023F4B598|nr:hypothetical protein [Dialister invisus]
MKKKIISACVWGGLVWGTVAFAADNAGYPVSEALFSVRNRRFSGFFEYFGGGLRDNRFFAFI